MNYSFKANTGVYIVSLTSCRGCRELNVFSSISFVLNVECVMWMWCRSWSLQREVRTKQTAGEQGISPLVMKAKDSGMDWAPRGRKRKMGRYVMIDSDRKRKWAWFRLIPAVLPAARPQPVICARVEEDVEFMKPYPFTQRLRSRYSSAVYVCV